MLLLIVFVKYRHVYNNKHHNVNVIMQSLNDRTNTDYSVSLFINYFYD